MSAGPVASFSAHFFEHSKKFERLFEVVLDLVGRFGRVVHG